MGAPNCCEKSELGLVHVPPPVERVGQCDFVGGVVGGAKFEHS